jgi:hypothetical protein
MTAIAELEQIARSARTARAGESDVVAIVDGAQGGRLSNGVPSGLGVTTRYGAAWFDGLRRSEAIAWFDDQADVYRLIGLLKAAPTTTRSAPRLVAADRGTGRSAEEGAVQAAEPASPTSLPADAGVDATSTPDRRRPSGAGSPPGAIDPIERPGPEPLGVVPIRSAAAPGMTVAPAVHQADGDPAGSGRAIAAVASPGRSTTCKACGRELPPPRAGQHRQTCDAACRQAYSRGHRAPVAGVVDDESLTRLSHPSRASDAGSRPGEGPPLDQLASWPVAGG